MRKCFNCNKVVECKNISPKGCDKYEPYYYTHAEVATKMHLSLSVFQRILHISSVKEVKKIVRESFDGEKISIEICGTNKKVMRFVKERRAYEPERVEV